MLEHESPAANARPSLRGREAVADADDVDPAGLEPPLYDVVDTNALDRLFEPTTRHGQLSFHYRGHEISVYASGRVDLE